MAGYCLPSIKKFCGEHDFNWKLFKTGVESSVLESYKLQQFDNVVKVARRSNGV
jgi:hypothetical protein